MGLVRRAICWMIFPSSAAPASQAHNNGSPRNEASGCAADTEVLQEPRSALRAKTNELRLYFHLTLSTGVLQRSPPIAFSFQRILIRIDFCPPWISFAFVLERIYSLDAGRENIAFSYSLRAVGNYVQMALSLTYSEGNKLLLRPK